MLISTSDEQRAMSTLSLGTPALTCSSAVCPELNYKASEPDPGQAHTKVDQMGKYWLIHFDLIS